MKKFIFYLILILFFIVLITSNYKHESCDIGVNDSLKITPGQDSIRKIDPVVRLKNKLTRLELEKTFWNSRISLAKDDHHHLVLNLPDSALYLDIKGTTVHECPLNKYSISGTIMSLLETDQAKQWLQEPFQLENEWATIPKRPIRVKDISYVGWEADSLDFSPSGADTTDVFIILQFSRDLTLGLKQDKEVTSNDPFLMHQKDSDPDSTLLENTINKKKQFSQLLNGLWIDVSITRSDAIAIFRAITKNSKIILRID
jgi:hypothetical protein